MSLLLSRFCVPHALGCDVLYLHKQFLKIIAVALISCVLSNPVLAVFSPFNQHAICIPSTNGTSSSFFSKEAVCPSLARFVSPLVLAPALMVLAMHVMAYTRTPAIPLPPPHVPEIHLNPDAEEKRLESPNYRVNTPDRAQQTAAFFRDFSAWLRDTPKSAMFKEIRTPMVAMLLNALRVSTDIDQMNVTLRLGGNDETPIFSYRSAPGLLSKVYWTVYDENLALLFYSSESVGFRTPFGSFSIYRIYTSGAVQFRIMDLTPPAGVDKEVSSTIDSIMSSMLAFGTMNQDFNELIGKKPAHIRALRFIPSPFGLVVHDYIYVIPDAIVKAAREATMPLFPPHLESIYIEKSGNWESRNSYEGFLRRLERVDPALYQKLAGLSDQGYVDFELMVHGAGHFEISESAARQSKILPLVLARAQFHNLFSNLRSNDKAIFEKVYKRFNTGATWSAELLKQIKEPYLSMLIMLNQFEYIFWSRVAIPDNGGKEKNSEFVNFFNHQFDAYARRGADEAQDIARLRAILASLQKASLKEGKKAASDIHKGLSKLKQKGRKSARTIRSAA